MFQKLFAKPAPVTAPEPAYLGAFELINHAAAEEYTDVHALAAAMGIEVSDYPYREEIVGTLQKFGDKWFIGVNRGDSINRQRFTIAHEIGHFVMHRDLVLLRTPLVGVADSRHYAQPDIESLHNPHILPMHETQANQIAIRILMGEAKMRALMEQGFNAEQIAPLIGCAAGAVRIRVDGLKSSCPS